MKKILLALMFILLLTSTAQAQTMISVDIRRAKLMWEWSQGTGGVADLFRVKCGPTTGNYTKITDVNDPAAREVAVAGVVSGVGTHFCVVAAANQFGESGPSNEVSFNAGDIPPPASNLRIQSQ